jgi:hypothetical protein
MKASLFFRLFVTLVSLATLSWTIQAQNTGADINLASFAGTWKGICQDGNRSLF